MAARLGRGRETLGCTVGEHGGQQLGLGGAGQLEADGVRSRQRGSLVPLMQLALAADQRGLACAVALRERLGDGTVRRPAEPLPSTQQDSG